MSVELPLLADLDPADDAALWAVCARRNLKRGDILDVRPGGEPTLLFLRDGLVWLAAADAEGEGVLAGLVGPGGIVGLDAALAERPGGYTAIALTEVSGFTVDAARLRRLAAERPGLALALAGVLAKQAMGTLDELACLAGHRIERRLARLLLRLGERIREPRLVVTQDELARMLSVQRTTVTMLANRLKEAKLIAYGRGRIRILDREGLARTACGCPI